MNKQDIKKVVLAYSVGLDTSSLFLGLRKTTTTAKLSRYPLTLVRELNLTDLKRRL